LLRQTEIKTIAVIGTTRKGEALAKSALGAGYAVVLEDVVESRLHVVAETLRNIEPKVSARLVLATTVEEALRDADLVIEAVVDELEVKLELFTIFDKFAKPNAILASSTERLAIEDFAEMTVCPERCIGFRLALGNKVHLTCGTKTAKETVSACAAVVRQMGSEVILTAPTAERG